MNTSALFHYEGVFIFLQDELKKTELNRKILIKENYVNSVVKWILVQAVRSDFVGGEC